MKRYRILQYDFDTRAHWLGLAIADDWELKVKQMHWQNRLNILDGLMSEYGRDGLAAKVVNFLDLGPSPLSVVAFHNKFAHQARVAFVMGSYYPALTATCALGERILNHLIRVLRDHFRSTDEYKRVHGKESIDDWRLAIDILERWDVLLPDTIGAFKELAEVRNRSLHFDPAMDTDDRPEALNALKLLNHIVESQFPAYGPQPWFLDVPGAAFIRKEWETRPFIREIYLPNARLVGPCHKLEHVNGTWVVHDIDYDDRNVSDEEFVAMLPGEARRHEARCLSNREHR